MWLVAWYKIEFFGSSAEVGICAVSNFDAEY